MQSAHAALEAGKAFADRLEPHPHFCICAVRDEKRLHHDLDKLVKAGIQICAWYEPDQNNELTAFATEPCKKEQRRLFRNFQLLKLEVPCQYISASDVKKNSPDTGIGIIVPKNVVTQNESKNPSHVSFAVSHFRAMGNEENTVLKLVKTKVKLYRFLLTRWFRCMKNS